MSLNQKQVAKLTIFNKKCHPVYPIYVIILEQVNYKLKHSCNYFIEQKKL